MKWINATDLNSWADRNDSHGLMPKVVRRLIHATTNAITRITFPSEEGIYIGGWDGIAETDAIHPFVPQGTSAWEFSSQKNPKSKVDNMYAKRKINSHSAVPIETTFVFSLLVVGPVRRNGKGINRRMASGGMSAPMMRTTSNNGLNSRQQ